MRAATERRHTGLLVLFLLFCGYASLASALDLGPRSAPLELPSLPASADASGVIEDGTAQVRARLLVGEFEGERRVGVLFDLAEGWHLYWRNPGGSGIAPELGLSVPGHRLRDLAWPSPLTFVEADGLFTTWGYEESVLLSAAIEPDATSSTGDIEAHPRVLVCRTQCVPAEFALRLPLEPGWSTEDAARVDARFAEAAARVPKPAADAGLAVRARWQGPAPGPDDGGTVRLELGPCTKSACPTLATRGGGALFIPRDGDLFEWEGASAEGEGVVDVALTRLEAIPTTGERLRGLLPVRDADGTLRHVAIDTPIATPETVAAIPPAPPAPTDLPAATPAIPATNPAPSRDAASAPNPSVSPAPANAAGSPATAATPTLLRWLQVLGLALLGGLILNGMPCVLPVLAIKVVAVADLAEKDPREVRMHGIAYGAGVLGSMALLAAVVVALRAAGHSVGWGFQFQEPLFVAVIAAVLVTFAMNLFGAFEIDFGQGRLATIGQDAQGTRRSFFEGLLAVVLATPCTAPFLGTAVGFAFASHGAGIFAIFLAIGLGLASPFLVVSFRPSAARFIPKSGPWMNTLRAGLGFSLLATCVWLLWVLGQSGGVDAVIGTTATLLVLAFLLWSFGRLQPLRSAWLGRAATIGIAAVALGGFNLIGIDRTPSATEAAAPAVGSEDQAWTPYSEAAVSEALAEGRPAFVVFTADWCLTCKMNEATVLDRDSVHAAFRAGGYALFEADWTRRDEAIRRKLAEFDRAGVPLYLVYSPERPDAPRVLSELLTADEVLVAIDEARPARRL
ncbi:MAG: thioredoxin family protein [Myxococcota bacterium]